MIDRAKHGIGRLTSRQVESGSQRPRQRLGKFFP
jgi:hypothetical protein